MLTHDGSRAGVHALSGMPLFQGIRPVRRSQLPKDILAGVTLAAMNIPQVLGYARIAGAPVVTGLYTLLLPVVAFATCGSSRYLVVAADSATAAILAGGLAGMATEASERYVALAALVALMTGGCLMLSRLFKLGFLADFLPQTVLVGFLAGVGVQVAVAMLGEMLGIQVHSRRTAGQLLELIGSLSSIRPLAMGISAAVVVCIFAIRRLAPVLPGPLLVVAGAIATSSALDFAGHGIRVVGPLAVGLPSLGFPEVNWKDASKLLPVALSCFVMIVAQGSATARAYALRHHQRLDENKDLLGLAVANVAAAFSGTFVVNGSPTQTAMVVRAGGQSQVSHLSAAVVAALVLLFLTGPLTLLPQCVLGAVVFTIVIGLIDLGRLREIRNESPGEFYLAMTTAAIVALVGVEEGILLAMALSLLRIVHNSYHPHTAVLVQDPHGEWRFTPVVPGAETESGLVIYRFAAPLFYANVNRFSEEIRTLVEQATAPVRWVVVDAGAITHADYTAARSVRQLQADLASRGVRLAFAHVGSYLRADLDRHHLTEAIGPARLFDTLHDTLAAIHLRS